MPPRAEPPPTAMKPHRTNLSPAGLTGVGIQPLPHFESNPATVILNAAKRSEESKMPGPKAAPTWRIPIPSARMRMEPRLSRLAVMDFRFLATLEMTGRRGRIVATSPLCLPLSAPAGGEIQRGGPFASLTRRKRLARLGARLDLVPAVGHRDEIDIGPGRRLVGEVRTRRMP